MKTITIKSLFILMLAATALNAQESTSSSEKFGSTLNAGLGIGYYGYVGHSMPVFHANFEIDLAKNFTLAPFITYFSYEKNHYWGNKNYPYRNYYYRVTVIPIGVKGTYYFDQLLNANNNWDFYLAGSLGFAIRNSSWEDGYQGDKHIERGASGVYLDVHIGTEYHLNDKLGLFLDLSTGVSTLGLAVHL